LLRFKGIGIAIALRRVGARRTPNVVRPKSNAAWMPACVTMFPLWALSRASRRANRLVCAVTS